MKELFHLIVYCFKRIFGLIKDDEPASVETRKEPDLQTGQAYLNGSKSRAHYVSRRGNVRSAKIVATDGDTIFLRRGRKKFVRDLVAA